MLCMLPCSWPFQFRQPLESMSESVTSTKSQCWCLPRAMHLPSEDPHRTMCEYPVLSSSQLHELSVFYYILVLRNYLRSSLADWFYTPKNFLRNRLCIHDLYYSQVNSCKRFWDIEDYVLFDSCAFLNKLLSSQLSCTRYWVAAIASTGTALMGRAYIAKNKKSNSWLWILK